MAEQRKSRGFTRADVLVAGAVCLVLVLLAPVVQAMTEALYIRNVCGNNLSQIGKAMLIYANDYEDELPRAGGRNSAWGPVANWTARNHTLAFCLAADGSGGKATINACFYLLVKYAEATPKLFVCGGDKGTSEFKLSDVSGMPWSFELVDAWDFGPSGPAGTSWRSCSYSYHLPFGSPYTLTISDDPNLAVAADRNPWFSSPASDAAAWGVFQPDDIPGYSGGTPETSRIGNAIAHQRDGQNVLFVDGRVAFETRSYCGVGQDNIYTVSSFWDGRPDEKGIMPSLASIPRSRKDSLLVHDPIFFAGM